MIARRTILAAFAAGGCSVLPERPYQDIRRFALTVERPAPLPAPPRGPVLLVRAFRAAPGLDERGLRRVGADGTVVNAPYEEWVAPPPELAEAALRRWLAAAGLYRAVVATGSRLESTLIIEAELSRFEIAPGEARVTIAGVLLAEPPARERVVRQFVAEGRAPVATPGVPPAPDAAAALNAALAQSCAAIEAELRGARAAGV